MKTDEQIRSDVLEEISWDPAVKSTNLGAAVIGGCVTLSGHVSSYAEKAAVERAAQRVGGVKALVTELTVRLAPQHGRSDVDIAHAAEHALAWNVLAPDESIKPVVEQGWLTLGGEVEWEYQRRAAERAMRDLVGVVGVTNAIRLVPKVEPTAVQKSIHDALERQADREAGKIRVEVNGRHVTLHGKVHSWAELAAVQGAAWSAPGVESVAVDLTVEP